MIQHVKFNTSIFIYPIFSRKGLAGQPVSFSDKVLFEREEMEGFGEKEKKKWKKERTLENEGFKRFIFLHLTFGN